MAGSPKRIQVLRTSPSSVAAFALTEESLRKKGYFHADRVRKLIDKIRRQDGRLLSERENMAITGILSTQLLDEMFIKNFPFHPVMEPENVKVYDFSSKV